MLLPCATTQPDPQPTTETPGWRMFHSDAGRLWATREEPFTDTAEQAGAWRTVDADDQIGLARTIAEQESIAQQSTEEGR